MNSTIVISVIARGLDILSPANNSRDIIITTVPTIYIVTSVMIGEKPIRTVSFTYKRSMINLAKMNIKITRAVVNAADPSKL